MYDLCSCTVHVDNIEFFICPNNAHNSYKIPIKLSSTQHSALSTRITGLTKYAATVPITSNNDMCNRYQHCNFGEAQVESSLVMIYVNRNILEQLL